MTGTHYHATGMSDGGASSWDKDYMQKARQASGTTSYIGYRLTNFLYIIIFIRFWATSKCT